MVWHENGELVLVMGLRWHCNPSFIHGLLWHCTRLQPSSMGKSPWISAASIAVLALSAVAASGADWLLTPNSAPAIVTASPCSIEISNGLIAREFAVPGAGCPAPEFATIDLLDLTSDPPRSVLAALDYEAAVELDGVLYNVGGFYQTCPEYTDPIDRSNPDILYSTCAYLNRSQPSYARPAANASAFTFKAFRSSNITAPFEYKPARFAADVPWPPLGTHLSVDFSSPGGAPSRIRGITVTVHYELFQGLPVYRKWLTLAVPQSDEAGASVVVGNVITESLRVNNDFAGTSYPMGQGWIQGSVPLIVAVPDLAHGAACVWGLQTEATYMQGSALSCSYANPGTVMAMCHPLANPPERCAGSGEPCPQCGATMCACPTYVVPAGAFVTLAKAAGSYFFPNTNSTHFVMETFRSRC